MDWKQEAVTPFKRKTHRLSEDERAKRRKRTARDSSLQRNYDLDIQTFELMLRIQNGKCRICKTRPATSVDHCHKTGKVRGILCNQCNAGLGMFKDNIEWLNEAAYYLDITRSR